MPKLFIPACGDRIVLTRSWTFTLYFERRNMEFAKRRGLVDEGADRWGVYVDGNYHNGLVNVPVTLHRGTVLECDRVYIRQFNKSADDDGFDSVTWKVVRDDKPLAKQRFWAKLSDCREIQFREESRYQDRVKVLRSVHDA